MQEGNRMHEAGRRELLGRNASEGIEPEIRIVGRADSVLVLEGSILFKRKRQV